MYASILTVFQEPIAEHFSNATTAAVSSTLAAEGNIMTSENFDLEKPAIGMQNVAAGIEPPVKPQRRAYKAGGSKRFELWVRT